MTQELLKDIHDKVLYQLVRYQSGFEDLEKHGKSAKRLSGLMKPKQNFLALTRTFGRISMLVITLNTPYPQ